MSREAKADKIEREAIVTLLRSGVNKLADNARIAELRRLMDLLERVLAVEMTESPWRLYWGQLHAELNACRRALAIKPTPEDRRTQTKLRTRSYRARRSVQENSPR